MLGAVPAGQAESVVAGVFGDLFALNETVGKNRAVGQGMDGGDSILRYPPVGIDGAVRAGCDSQ